MKLIKVILFCCSATLGFSMVPIPASHMISVAQCFSSNLTLKHREKKGVGFDDGYTTAGVFLSPSKNIYSVFPFLDVKAHMFNDGELAANAGIGTRFFGYDESNAFGLNAFYDYRKSNELAAHQLGAGFEVLTSFVSLTVNGYYPFFGKSSCYDPQFDQFEGNNILVKENIEYSFPAADAELGFILPPPFSQLGVYLGLGGYYLFKRDSHSYSEGDILGFKARLSVSPNPYLSFGAEGSYDDLFGKRVNGYLALNLPLGSPVKKSRGRRSSKRSSSVNLACMPVTRSEIIPFYNKTYSRPLENSDGSPCNVVFVYPEESPPIGAGNLDYSTPPQVQGSIENPHLSIDDAIEQSNPNDLIYVLYSGKPVINKSSLELKESQILSSSGVDVVYKGVTIPAKDPGLFSTMTSIEGPVLILDDTKFNKISGLYFESNEESPVIVANNTALNISHCSFLSESTHPSIVFENPKGYVELSNNDFFGSSASSLVEIKGHDSTHVDALLLSQNSFYAKDERSALTVSDVSGYISVHENTFSSTDAKISALEISSHKDLPSKIVFSGNKILDGCSGGIIVNSFGENPSKVVVENNFFKSKDLDCASFINGVENNPYFLCKNNTIESSNGPGIELHLQGANDSKIQIAKNKFVCGNKGVLVLDRSIGSNEVDISENTFDMNSSFSAIDIDTKNSGLYTVHENRVYYNLENAPLSGISFTLDTAADVFTKAFFEHNVSHMNSNDTALLVENKGQGTLVTSIHGNQKDPGCQGAISLKNSSSGEMQAYVEHNFSRDVDSLHCPFSLFLENSIDGEFTIFSSKKDQDLSRLNSGASTYFSPIEDDFTFRVFSSN